MFPYEMETRASFKQMSDRTRSFRTAITIALLGACLGGFILSVVWTGLYLLMKAPPFPPVWIGIGGLAFGVLLGLCGAASERAIAEDRRVRSRVIAGQHPVIGAYKFFPFSGSWSAEVDLTSDCRVELRGPGESPSAAQVRTWESIRSSSRRLAAAAASALQLPEEAGDCSMMPELVPRRVALNMDGGFVIHYDAEPFSDMIYLWPTGYFSPAMELLSMEWEP